VAFSQGRAQSRSATFRFGMMLHFEIERGGLNWRDFVGDSDSLGPESLKTWAEVI
jgi:hypothetical protein